ncbi:MAG: cupredoxin domain-containing protein [bacterium]
MDKISKQNLIVIIAIILAAGGIFFAINYTGETNPTSLNGQEKNSTEETANNVSIVDGKQIIVLKAKGGFSPIHSFAKAGVPTILRVSTNGTFDCSSIIRIPDMNISRNLPMTGTTDIDIGSQVAGIFDGTCGMGMYPFDIKFE